MASPKVRKLGWDGGWTQEERDLKLSHTLTMGIQENGRLVIQIMQNCE